MSEEANWLQRKAEYEADRDALLALGLPIETVKRLAGWQHRLDYDTYAESRAGVWPPGAVALPPVSGQRQSLRLMFSRSESRANAGNLEGAVLDAGKLYAIFIPDVPELTITQVTFELNGAPVHTEFSKPWDYAGTTPGGDSTRVTFVAGTYTIGATVVDAGGFYSFSAAFEVE